MRYLLLLLLVCFSIASCVAGPRSLATQKASIRVYPDKVTGALAPQLFGTNLGIGDKARIADPAIMESVKKLHLGSIRFPNGCQADVYNWLDPGGHATVDEFLDFCDEIGAEAYYTINMQGGTENLEGPIPADASLDERIRYRHTAPNPCGNTNYYFGTLDETRQLVRKHTVERALSGKRPLLYYEMGNENWGQARTDWTPDVYGGTIEAYATEMRKALRDAAVEHPELANLKLHITAVGYPVMGNNMKMADTPDYKTNIDWTRRLNDLHRKGIIDAVQEHFYPYGNADGGALAWATHNLANILDVRLGIPNPRLDGYKDASLAYTMPIEFTEWNVKCWGTAHKSEALANPGFEDRLFGWQTAGDGKVTVCSPARRQGERGVSLECSDGEWCRISQKVTRGDYTFPALGVWVRADDPSSVKVFMLQTSDGPNKGKQLGEAGSPPNPFIWQRVVVGGKLEDDTTEFEVVIRVEGKAQVWIDEVSLHSLKTTSGIRPLSSDTFEQQLFCVDALRVMAEKGSQRAHMHHLFGNYPCGLINADGTLRDNYRAFELFGGFVGDRLVESECKAGVFRYDHSGRSYATDFNGLAPKIESVPAFSIQASRTDDTLYLLLMNRCSDRSVEASIDLGIEPASPIARVRILSGDDIDLPGSRLEESEIQVSRRFTHRVEPYSAQIIAVKIK